MIVNVAEDVVFTDVLGVTLGPDGSTRVPVERVIHRWTITIDTAPRFLLVADECSCALKRAIGVVYLPGDAGPWSRGEVDYIRYADKVNCTCPYTGNKCARGFTGKRQFDACHGWHRPKVDAMVAKIRKPITPRAALAAALRKVAAPPRDMYVRTDFDRLVKPMETLS